MISLLLTRVGFIVFLPMLISITCTNFITVSLAVREFINTAEIFGATGIFALHYLIPVVASPFVIRAIGKLKPANILVVAEIFNAVVVLGLIIALLLDWNVWILALWISLFGLSETAARSVRLEIIKVMAPEAQWKSLNALAQLAVYLGMAAGGVIIAIYSSSDYVYQMLIAAIVCFLVVAVSYAVLFRGQVHTYVRSQQTPRVRDYVSYTLSNSVVLQNFAFVVLSMAIFQSFMQFGRIIVPLREGGVLTVAAYQYCILGAFISSALTSGWFGRRMSTKFDLAIYCTLAAIFLWVASNVDSVIVSASAFFAYIFFFELVFIIAVGRLLNASREDMVFGVSYLYQIVGGALIFTASLIGALLTDRVGLTVSSSLFASIAVITSLTLVVRSRMRDTYAHGLVSSGKKGAAR